MPNHDRSNHSTSNLYPQDAAALAQQGQRLVRDASTLADTASTTARSARSWARSTVDNHPLGVVLTAAAAGYVVAGGLSSQFTWLMFRTGGRVLLDRAVHEIYSMIAKLGD